MGICLKTVDYSETSQVVYFLTRDAGVVNLMAKGTKRPKSKSGGAIDLLAEGQVVFSQKNPETLGLLMEFSETVSRTPLRRDARRLNVSLYMIELIGKMLPEGDPHPSVFDLLHNALERLGQNDAPPQAVLAFFQWRFLRHIGLLGQLNTCASCQANICEIPPDAGLYFSSQQGGILCPHCHAPTNEKFRITPPCLAGIGALLTVTKGQKATLPETQAVEVNRLLGYHITHQLGRPLKMTKYVISTGTRE
ncbi:MAG: DNA repair protein RecO [Phycisphaerae bacterium]|nr:DNA repair protein RecO [Phycisphaerae bacterium]